MRIIGGQLGGLRFKGPLNDSTRPTPERAREGMASALEARGAFEGALVLDLFAGTGALSFEALSRGAARAVLVERDNRIHQSITEAARSLKIQDRVAVLCLDLFQNPAYTASRIALINGKPFDLVFADPPYSDGDRLTPLLKELASQRRLRNGCFIAIEHASGRPPEGIEQLGTVDSYRYGDTTIAILQISSQGENGV
jgi:16S rRNA (guanine966-N2)-methyltransferase